MPVYEPPKGNIAHTELPGRDQPEQHPIGAITKLSQELDAKVNADDALTAIDIIKIMEE